MNEFIHEELARKLYKKGFPKPNKVIYAEYRDGGEIYPMQVFFNFNNHHPIAPTISQVLWWLRNKGILVKTGISYDTSEDADGNVVDRWIFWLFEIFSILDGSLIYVEETKEYDTYEQAAIAGISYVVDNLI